MSSSAKISEVAEERVTIPGPDVNLEGRLAVGDVVSGVVITHPHPMYGGTMDNNVVWTAARAFQARRWSTLRFNFRGVGLSSGEYGGRKINSTLSVITNAFALWKAPLSNRITFNSS